MQSPCGCIVLHCTMRCTFRSGCSTANGRAQLVSAEMAIALATINFALALVAASNGIVTEYRQTRTDGPVAIVGTMPWAVAASIFSLLGLLSLPFSLNWWWYPIVFVAVLLVSGWSIMRASKRPDR